MWIDTHAHVTASDFGEDRAEALDRASAAGVGRVIAIGSGYGVSECAAAAKLAERDPRVFATAGVHPHDAKEWSEAALTELRQWLAKPRVVAVGECGLDYFYDNSPREEQREALAAQLALAVELDLPVVLHLRCKADDAYDDFLDIWRASSGAALQGIVHCFTGGADFARKALDLGLHISFSGIVTFKRAEALRETAKQVPLTRLLVETDAPFLAPQAHRGRRNEPAYVVEVGQCLADLHGMAVEELAHITTHNAERLFELPPLASEAPCDSGAPCNGGDPSA